MAAVAVLLIHIESKAVMPKSNMEAMLSFPLEAVSTFCAMSLSIP